MCVALNGFFWDQPRTGSGQYLRHLWDELLRLTSTRVDDPRLELLKPGERPGNRVLGGGSGNLGKLLWEQWSVVTKARWSSAKLLHVPYLAAPLVKRIPVVVTAHDMIPWVIPGYKGSAAVQLYLALAAAGVRRANLIIANSEASRRDVIRVLKISPRKVRTVYLGMEQHPDYSERQLEDLRARYGLPRNFAFYLGGFDLRKNVPLLLKAWHGALDALRSDNQNADQPVLAIGGGIPEPGELFPDVRVEAAQLGLDLPGGPLRFLGRVSEEEKPLFMAAARLFIYPSSYEGFGLDPLEAMSVGCPVVSSWGGSLREVVGEGGLLVPPGEEVALRQAIVRAWTDDELRSRLQAKGKEQSRQFTWKRTAEQTLQLYVAVLKRQHARSAS